MSHMSQVWKRLIIYLQGTELEQMPTTTSVEDEVILPIEKKIKEQDKNIEFSQKNLHQFIFPEQLQKSLEEWTKPSSGSFNIREMPPGTLLFSCRRGYPNETTPEGDRQLHEQIYNILGNATLTPETVEQVINLLTTSQEFRPVLLFERLEDFYRRWCQGEFIDAAPDDNLPQKKMLQLQAQNIILGLRHIDIQTGLNVMILLLELHRYAQTQDDLKQKINFYPSSQPGKENFFTSQLLRIINYSDAIEIGNFSNIVGEFLRGGNFSGAYLGDANLTGANFSQANLKNTYLGDANLTGVNFSNANLKDANLGDANLSGANLSGANLNRADLSSADLSSTNLSGANLSGANLSGTNLRDADLNHANLCDAILFGANLSEANLKGVNLNHADLCRADLSGADLSSAKLNGTNLSDTILFSTNLSNAVLVAADLSYAKLNGAKLNHANLSSVMFLGADLSDTDLSGVTLNQADLSGVTLNDADLSGADLSEAVLFGTDFSGANLTSANLSGSNLSGAIFSSANLSNSNLSYAILGNTDLSDANLERLTWNENQYWQGVRGLDTAVNVPEELKQQLGLR